MPEPKKDNAGNENAYPVNPFGRPYPKGIDKSGSKQKRKISDVNSHYAHLYAQGRINVTNADNTVEERIGERH